MHLGRLKSSVVIATASLEAKLREGFLCVARVSHSGPVHASHSQGLQRWLMELKEGRDNPPSPSPSTVRQDERHWDIHSGRRVQTLKMTNKEKYIRGLLLLQQVHNGLWESRLWSTDKSATVFHCWKNKWCYQSHLNLSLQANDSKPQFSLLTAASRPSFITQATTDLSHTHSLLVT